MELGGGCGLLGCVVSHLAPASMIVTDGSPQAVDNCQQNLSLNGVEVSEGQSVRVPGWPLQLASEAAFAGVRLARR